MPAVTADTLTLPRVPVPGLGDVPRPVKKPAARRHDGGDGPFFAASRCGPGMRHATAMVGQRQKRSCWITRDLATTLTVGLTPHATVSQRR